MEEEVFEKFAALVSRARILAEECKTAGSPEPTVQLYKSCKVTSQSHTDTGVLPGGWEISYVPKPDWFQPCQHVLKRLEREPVYEELLRALQLHRGQDVGKEFERAVSIIAGTMFESTQPEDRVTFEYFLKNFGNEPVPAWSETDLYGVFVKDTASIQFSAGERKISIRQLTARDFEYESYHFFEPKRALPGVTPPSSILRADLNTWRPADFQMETSKAVFILRLFGVGSVSAGEQVYHSESPFTYIRGSSSPGQIKKGGHSLMLTTDLVEELTAFWQALEPRLPDEIRNFGPKRESFLMIAYERYCEALFSPGSIDRKITFAIMAMEAIYLGTNEVQELMYRLQQRMCKFLSKLRLDVTIVRQHLKLGYQIRNTYVHGGHLSETERKKLEKRGIDLNSLAVALLDYVRISIVHLLLSSQSKEDFLAILESSMLVRAEDDALQRLVEPHLKLLRGRTHAGDAATRGDG